MNIIFYGAGKYAADNIDRLKSDGIVPVCFADADGSKQGTQICGYDVLSLENAISKYPDCVLQITLYRWNLKDTTEYLLGKGIPLDKIRYCEAVEYRKGCDFLGTHIGLSYDSFHICCNTVHYKDIPRTGDISKDLELYKQYIANLTDNLRNGETTPCDRCPALQYDVWDINPKLWRIGFGCDFSRTKCNFKCGYCCADEMLKRCHEPNMESPADAMKKVSLALQPNDVVLGFAAGEITVCPWKNDVYKQIEDDGWYCQISTNAALYDDRLAELIKRKSAELNISIDAGTPETFEKIKGVDAWDKVIKNLEKYCLLGGRVILKYLFIDGVNNRLEDIDGFIELCSRFDVVVSISTDFTVERELSQESLRMCLYIIEKLKDSKEFVFLRYFLMPNSRKVIEDALNCK
jgi:uncharacterized Fe-S cluster-containing radical SAM superfamily protein